MKSFNYLPIYPIWQLAKNGITGQMHWVRCMIPPTIACQDENGSIGEARVCFVAEPYTLDDGSPIEGIDIVCVELQPVFSFALERPGDLDTNAIYSDSGWFYDAFIRNRNRVKKCA